MFHPSKGIQDPTTFKGLHRETPSLTSPFMSLNIESSNIIINISNTEVTLFMTTHKENNYKEEETVAMITATDYLQR